MTDYAALLNPEQLEAATAGDGPLLVLAAAGTGKTRTLVYRVSYLVEKGIPPENMLLLTFTNRAAREMMERARQQVGDSVGTLMSGTFHHICNRFLRHFATRLGYEPGFTILDQDDSRSLIKKCIVECVPNPKDFPKKDVIGSLISKAANKCVPIDTVIDESAFELKTLYASGIRQVSDLYAKRKRELGVMDFDDLLINGLKLLRENEDVLSFYQERFVHVLVDEYQDTNLLQAQIVDLLAAKHRNLMVVGDDFQCIYSWRGAHFKNIMEFPKRWPDCKIVRLERNYRSVPAILEVANEVIKGNPDQFQKTLRATRSPGAQPHLFKLRDASEQVSAVLGLIRRFLDAGYRLDQMAVLYRAHFHSIELQMDLARSRIPYCITSGAGVFEQAHVKDVISFLRICEHPRDQMAFERFMGLLDGVGEKTVAKIWDKIGRIFDVCSKTSRDALLKAAPAKAKKQIQSLVSIFEEYQHTAKARQGSELLSRFCDLFYSDYLRRKYDNADDRENDIREVGRQIDAASGGIAGFLQEVALLTNEDAAHGHDDNQDRIHLSTVHQSKGLEWPVVFIIWASEGMFPSGKLEDDADDSEERRLFYVALTRAKDHLIISSPSVRFMRDGGTMICKPSRFLKEIPRNLLHEHYSLRDLGGGY